MDIVEFAKVGTGGHTADGLGVFFTLIDRHGKEHSFGCPFDRIGELVENLLAYATAAASVRGAPEEEPFKAFTRLRATTKALTGFTAGASADNSLVVLETDHAPAIRRGTTMTPEQCKLLVEGLQDALRHIERMSRSAGQPN